MSYRWTTAGPISRSWKKTEGATELSEMSFIQLGFGSKIPRRGDFSRTLRSDLRALYPRIDQNSKQAQLTLI